MAWPLRLFLGIVACVLTGLLVWTWGSVDPPAPADREAPPAPPEASFTTPPAAAPAVDLSAYVGVDACGKCHPAQLASYQQTAHAEAFAVVDPTEEPPDQAFTHALSGRAYKVYRKADQLWHRESGSSDDTESGVTSDLPVTYRVGSGHHSRTYLAEVDGFLMESPVTWYTARQTWDMSPGYDRPHHLGFERAADLGCLVCHVGLAERQQGALHRLRFVQQAISCENCHGPGAEHVALHESMTDLSTSAVDADVDPIVHPAKLDRERAEAVCAQCHLRGAATVFRRGKDLHSFRPGMKLTDVRADFRLLRENDQRMNVTGHFDQLWLSRCYTESSSLTCTTCHDPHHPPPEDTKPTYYRQKCLQCHAAEDCGVPVDAAPRTRVADNCNHCHMPQVPTDIPHIAFTHHRIGVDHQPDQTEPPPASDLQPLIDLTGWTADEQARAVALACLEVPQTSFVQPKDATAAATLSRIIQQDPQDAVVSSALARLLWSHRPRQAMQLAELSLASGAQAKDRANALFVLGDLSLQAGQPRQARAALEQLTTLRRHSEDWLLLSQCRWMLGDHAGAVVAIDTALQINPFRPELHETRSRLTGDDTPTP